MRLLHLTSVLCVVGAVGISASSAAQTKTPAASSVVAATDRARALHLEGAALFEQKKYDQAYVAFVAAWALKRHPQIAANLADCEVKLGKYRDAAEHFMFMVRDPKGEAQSEEKQEAQRRLKEVQAKIGTLAITVNVGGAEVLVDGKSMGTSPLQEPIFVDPGSHTVEARKEGFPSARMTTTVAASSSSALTLDLQSPPTVEAKSIKLLVGGTALTAVLLGSGIVFTVVSNGKASDADAKLNDLHTVGGSRPCVSGKLAADCATLASLNQSSDTFHNLAIVGYAVAGAVGIATLTYALVPTKKEPVRVGVTVAPLLGGGVGGFLMSGEF